jgi:hypothetical protein
MIESGIMLDYAENVGTTRRNISLSKHLKDRKMKEAFIEMSQSIAFYMPIPNQLYVPIKELAFGSDEERFSKNPYEDLALKCGLFKTRKEISKDFKWSMSKICEALQVIKTGCLVTTDFTQPQQPTSAMKECSYTNIYTTYKLDTGECAKWYFNDLLFNAMSFKMPRFLALDDTIGKEKIRFLAEELKELKVEKEKIEKIGVSLDWLQLFEIFEKHNEIVHHLSYVMARVIADPRVYKSIQDQKKHHLSSELGSVFSDTFKTPKYEWSENFNLDLYKRISSLIMINNELVK